MNNTTNDEGEAEQIDLVPAEEKPASPKAVTPLWKWGAIGLLTLLGGDKGLDLHRFLSHNETNRDWREPSGLEIHLDYRTGVYYLSGPDGGLTPRLGTDGKPMVKEAHAIVEKVLKNAAAGSEF